jgi:monomeric sarcosine oxidase
VATKVFDAAILGLGTMGAFACLELARRGLKVVAFDRFAPPHDRGSHGGATRVFRTAYAEHPDYVPLAQRAGVLWDRMGQEAGTLFLHRCGMLSLGPAGSSLIAGARASATAHRLTLEELAADQVRSRFPAFAPPTGWTALLEPAAGWVDVDGAIRFALQQATRAGADVRLNTSVDGWDERGAAFRIATPAGDFMAQLLVIAGGAWTGGLMPDLQLPIKILRKALIWVDPLRPEQFAPGVFPIFASADRFFYGFPNIGNAGVKLATHSSEFAPAGDTADSLPKPGLDEIRPLLEAAAELFPSLAGPMPGAMERVIASKSCLYCMTPDEDFVIDRHPRHENVWFAAGFSGHGFKFAPAIGEVLADLAIEGTTDLPIEFLSMNRLSLMDS